VAAFAVAFASEFAFAVGFVLVVTLAAAAGFALALAASVGRLLLACLRLVVLADTAALAVAALPP
jgi:hypothetical protein